LGAGQRNLDDHVRAAQRRRAALGVHAEKHVLRGHALLVQYVVLGLHTTIGRVLVLELGELAVGDFGVIPDGLGVDLFDDDLGLVVGIDDAFGL
jgi:hypothetical protein